MSTYLHRTVEMADGRKIRVEVRVAKLLKLLPKHLRTVDNMMDISQRVI
mgnify:CR=1 FL=1